MYSLRMRTDCLLPICTFSKLYISPIGQNLSAVVIDKYLRLDDPEVHSHGEANITVKNPK